MQTKPGTSSLKNSSPFFTIVIPSLNEEKILPRLLKDLAQQTFKDFSVIHIDGKSEDKTVKEAQKFENKLDLKIKIVKKRNVAFQRNVGGNMARGEWIIFMDADNRLPKYFLQGLKYQIEKYETKGKVDLFTTWVTIDKKKSIDKTVEKTINFWLELYIILGKEVAIGALIGIRKKIFEKINFDEKHKIFEDVLFVQKVIKAGHIFRLFKEPRYSFSLRRAEAEGALKMISIAAKTNANYILGGKFHKKDFGYVMKGGKYYQSVKRGPFVGIQNFLENATKEQLKKARKIWRNLKDW